MSSETILLKHRLLVMSVYIAVTFLLGSLIFYLFAHGEARKYYWLAVALFPGGFVIFGLGKASTAVGWTAYALCLAGLIGFARRKAFLITCSILTILILINLIGCGVVLKE
jgi:MprA protease rhombosortase-interaction domain-containing protein